MLGIEYAPFNPSSFLKPFLAEIKESKSQEIMSEIGTAGYGALWGLSEHGTRATSRDILGLNRPLKRDIRILAVFLIKIDHILFCENNLKLSKNVVRTIWFYSFHKPV